ncbi:hypothetical protein TNCV_3093351 [Trichonephila clavipes]|nr:hypothetical protein TNCV_3093351 [Trichonephila clavipes]
MGELERSIALDQLFHFLGCSRRQGWLPKLFFIVKLGIGGQNTMHKSCLTILPFFDNIPMRTWENVPFAIIVGLPRNACVPSIPFFTRILSETYKSERCFEHFSFVMDPIDAFPEHISITVVPVPLPDKPDALEYAAR